MSKMPGDLNDDQFMDQVIRVNHAGEYGAKRIYKGQMAILKNADDQKMLKHMADQEEVHLDYFVKEMQQRKIRPSVFLPLWHTLGYALGAGTALLGKNSAMVCTEAVEEVIDQHYQEQLKKLDPKKEKDLTENIEKFRQEELEHHHMAKDNMKDLNLGHKILYNAIKLGCKLSIEIAKKF